MDYLAGVGHLLIVNAPQLVGFVMPPLVEVLNKDVKTGNQRFLVAILVCLVVAILLHWNQIEYGTPEQIVAFAGIIFVESQSTYQLYFNNSRFQGFIQQSINSSQIQ